MCRERWCNVELATVSTTFEFKCLEEVFSEFFPQVNKHIQLNVLLRQWEEKQRRSKKYWNEKFNHDGFLSENTYRNVLYIINPKDKMTLIKRVYEMQNYIKKNSPIDLGNSEVAYMFLNKTNNINIDINEYSKRYKKLILSELNILKPVLIVVCDNNYNTLSNIIKDKRNENLTKNICHIPILNMSPLTMSNATKREYLLYFKYLFDKKFL